MRFASTRNLIRAHRKQRTQVLGLPHSEGSGPRNSHELRKVPFGLHSSYFRFLFTRNFYAFALNADGDLELGHEWNGLEWVP